MNDGRDKPPKRRGSLFMHAINSLTEYLYSVFKHGHTGDALTADNKLFHESMIRNATTRKRSRGQSRTGRYLYSLFEDNIASGLINAARGLLAALAFNVYGIFFLAFGVSAIFTHYAPIIIGGEIKHDFYAVICAIGILLCSLPMLTSPQSVSQKASESKLVRRITLSFLGFSEENLKYKKAVGGTAIMFISAGLGLGLGALTYFWHPMYFLIALAVLVLASLISANPETGIAISVIGAPFLQYSPYPVAILTLTVCFTAFAYVCKVIRRKRIPRKMVPESVFLLIFCGFILAASLGSAGGVQGFLDSLMAVILIFCGFFLTYNMTRGKKRLEMTTRLFGISFIVICILGLWDVFHNRVAEGFVYSVHDGIKPLVESGETPFGIADGASVFSVLAVMVFPILFLYVAKSATFKRIAALIVAILICITASVIYGTYEALVAVLAELIIFWFMWSHKSLSASLIMLIPIGIFAFGYPVLAEHMGWYSFGDLIGFVMPANDGMSAVRDGVMADTSRMLFDGNLLGIGAGTHAFTAAFAPYATPISAGACEAGCFMLQLLCWSGIFGGITFIAFAGVLIKNAIGYLMLSRDTVLRGGTLAMLCIFFMTLAFGAVNCIWTDMRMLFLFFVAAGLLAAHVRDGRDAMRVNELSRNDLEDSKDVRVNLK